MKLWKLNGIGIAYALAVLIYALMMAVIGGWLTGFRWSTTALKVFLPVILVLVATFIGIRCLTETWSVCLGLLVTAVSGVASLLILQKLLGLNLLALVKAKLGLAKKSN
jgi:hypothetical protein